MSALSQILTTVIDRLTATADQTNTMTDLIRLGVPTFNAVDTRTSLLATGRIPQQWTYVPQSMLSALPYHPLKPAM
jgi:hypothetical protein